MQNNNKKAFSLIELIFIIAILGIIAAVAIPKLMGSRSNAIVSSIKQDVATITSSVQSYYMLNNGIDKISDAVNINEKVWTLSDKKAVYNIDGQSCISIEVTDTKLNLTIKPDSNTICQKISDAGIKNISYDLF